MVCVCVVRVYLYARTCVRECIKWVIKSNYLIEVPFVAKLGLLKRFYMKRYFNLSLKGYLNDLYVYARGSCDNWLTVLVFIMGQLCV